MIEIRSFRDILRLFFIFRREFTRALAATVIVAVLGAFLLPSRYASDARLLVRPGENVNMQLSPTPGEPQGFIQPSTQRDPLLDEEKMLTSDPVAHKVAEYYLRAIDNGPPPGLWGKTKYYLKRALGAVAETLRRSLVAVNILDDAPAADRLAGKLEKSFEVSHDAGSNVMEMRFSWNDPTVAQKIAQAWVDAYFDQRADAAGGRQLYDFYAQQSLELGNQIVDLKRQLREQLQTIDASSVQQQMDSVADQLQRLYKQRQDAVGEREASQGALSEAQGELPRLPREVVTEREISLNPAQQDLLLKLNGLRAQRLDLLRTYREDAPPLRAIDESIRAMQAQIDAQRSDVQRSQNLAPNALATRLQQNMQDARVNIAQLDARIAAYDQQIAELQAQREHTMAAEPALSKLSLQLTTAEKAYAQYTDYLLHARTVRDLNSHRLSNVTVIEQPTYAPSRVFPKSLLILLLALPAGIGVGLFAIFLCYLLDQRVHDGGRVEATLSVPLWASLPELGEPRAPGLLNAALYRIYGLLPLQQLAQRGITLGLSSSQHGEGVSFVARRLCRILTEHGHAARIGGRPAGAGEIVLIDAAPLSDERALLQLQAADLRLLVVQARRTTLPAIEQALGLLRQAFGRVDGIVISRRRYEIPERLLQRFARWQGRD